MDTKETRELWEAYQQIYAPQELTEEVEIAAEYFYNLGLNEEGVDIFIEELGVEDFGHFVYQLAEEYFLDEAAQTRLQSGGALKGPKGSKPQSTTKARIKAQGGTRMSASGAPASTVNPKKVAAAAKKAKEKQSQEKGVIGRLRGAVQRGMERHNAAMAAAKETGKTIRKAAGKIGGVAKEVGKGASGAARLAGHIASKGLGEETDLFDYILEHLVVEGYADTEEAALAIMANMSEEWKQSIAESVPGERPGVPGETYAQRQARMRRNP